MHKDIPIISIKISNKDLEFLGLYSVNAAESTGQNIIRKVT